MNGILDRTFADVSSTRWIIDYKTGRHTGGRLEEFLDRERIRYEPQLQRYAVLMANLDPRPIRLGLYFSGSCGLAGMRSAERINSRLESDFKRCSVSGRFFCFNVKDFASVDER